MLEHAETIVLLYIGTNITDFDLLCMSQVSWFFLLVNHGFS